MSQAQLLPSTDPIPTFPAIAYKGTPVLTTEMLAHAYGVSAKQIRQNFNNNRARFTEGKHFYMLYGNKLKEFKNCVEIIDTVAIPTRTKNLTLWTDRGSARHAKMLETDTAWDVYELLEDTFFNVKPKSLPATLTPSTPDTRRPLEKLVKVWASQAHMPHAQAWTQVNAHFTLNGISELPVEWIPDAVAFVEGKIDALPKALPAGNAKQEEYRRRCHREDLELALKMIHLVGLEVAAQCKVIQRILNNKIETMP